MPLPLPFLPYTPSIYCPSHTFPEVEVEFNNISSPLRIKRRIILRIIPINLTCNQNLAPRPANTGQGAIFIGLCAYRPKPHPRQLSIIHALAIVRSLRVKNYQLSTRSDRTRRSAVKNYQTTLTSIPARRNLLVRPAGMALSVMIQSSSFTLPTWT